MLRFFYVSAWSAGLADKSLVLIYRTNKVKRPRKKVKGSLKTCLNQEEFNLPNPSDLDITTVLKERPKGVYICLQSSFAYTTDLSCGQ